MKKLFAKIKNNLPTGLTAKLIRAVVIIFFIIGLVFFILSTLQVYELEKLVRSEGEEHTEQIAAESTEAMDKLIRDSLKELSYMAADKTDDELWVNGYELSILSAQVKDVLEHPENYNRIPVYKPDPKNADKLTLQLLAPNGYENISPESMEKLERLANLAPIMATYIGSYTIDCYISLPDGTTIAMDKMSHKKFDENGNVKPYDATTRPWFKEAVELGDTRFGPAEHSFFYDFNIVVYSYPIYVNGELGAVLEGALKIDKLQGRVEACLLGDTGFNVLISKHGQLVSTSRQEGELAMRAELSEDIRNTVNPEIKKIIDLGLAGESGTEIVEVDGKKYYAGYAPLVTVNWTQISFLSVDEMMEPTVRMTEETRESYERMEGRIKNAFRASLIAMFMVIGIVVILTIIVVSRLARKRVKPIKHMTMRVNEMSGDSLDFKMEDIYKTGDEIETLARAFESQSEKLKSYMAENIRISAEKQKIDAEMSMATQIQDSMLPKLTAAFSDRQEFDLYAKTVPAIDVGGDFYDFFFVDDDHLAIVIADVSGKGITAALFMALSKQMIQSQLLLCDGDIEKALTTSNVRLIEESIPDMFVTVWLGMVTLSTGDLKFIDAGHEYPAISRKGGQFAIEKDIHSITVAALKKAKFKTNELTLEHGDMIYLYTDGVTEAHNKAGDMFGMERLNEALNEAAGMAPEEVDKKVRERIAEFVGETEQFDDITTLCFRYN